MPRTAARRGALARAAAGAMTAFTWPGVIEIDAFATFTLAIVLLFAGKGLAARLTWLRRYGIPEPVVGGLLCAGAVWALHDGLGLRVDFALGARDMLLLYFFAAIGLNSDLRTLRSGGRPLLVLAALASGFIVVQNLAGMAVAKGFDLDRRAGLMVGSIALTGGVGMTLAWTPYFERLGIAAAGELGLAANMIGLIAACVIGGPVAGWLMRRHRLQPSGDAALEIGSLRRAPAGEPLDYQAVLLAVLWLNIALMLGRGTSALFELAGLTLPAFVGCLLAGIALRALGDAVSAPDRTGLWHWPSLRPGIALISDISLGLFLTMALMGLRLWELEPVAGLIAAAMVLQITLAVAFTVGIVFRCMGRDYEAAVICAGFGGIALGSTATAIANMSAVTREYGAAPRAFVVVPLVCGFVIDLVNALVIGLMAR